VRSPLHVLVVHNSYVLRGGEDAVVEREVRLLRDGGHRVSELRTSNRELAPATVLDRAGLAAGTVWSPSGRAAMGEAIDRHRPDVVHVHNTFPRLSPSVFGACRRRSVPVVQTLHNYRLTCVNALLLRDGRICEDCVGKPLPLPGVLHRCYRGSVGQSATIAAMAGAHRAVRSLAGSVDLFLTPSEFTRSVLVRAGIPADRIVAKPNVVPRHGRPVPALGDRPRRVAFVGRLAHEKGLAVLMAAWDARRHAGHELRIVGGGPMADEVAAWAAGRDDVVVVGECPPDRVTEELLAARLLVVPSVWHETFGLVAVEAFGAGVPVLASAVGALPELLGETGPGRLVPPGDPAALAAAVDGLLADEPTLAAMSRLGPERYERFAPERGLEELVACYDRVRRAER
jgi:glycosyltransferase involved in cell wall biosynthesis